jgi:iron complex outermembrane receptor protein
MRALSRWLCVVLFLVLGVANAHADSRRDAKRHFQRGMSLVKEGQTDKGVSELERAYDLKPHPNVLFNIARAYDVAGRTQDAADAYERYIAAGPADPSAAEARLAQLRDILAARTKAAEPPTTASPQPPPRAHSTNVAVEALLRAAETWEARATQLESQRREAPAPPAPRIPEAVPERETPAPVTTEIPWWQGLLLGGSTPDAPSAPEDVYERTVVSASRTGRSVVMAPASVSVLTDEDIRSSGARTIPDLLRRVAGVDVVAMSATDQNVSIRGFNQRISNRVLVLVDGRSVYQDYLGATFWSSLTFNLDDVERIEVIRGPGAALYGANAVVGIINIITRKPAAGTVAQARATLGWPLMLDAAARGSTTQGPLGVSASVGYSRTRKWALELDTSRKDVVPSYADIPYDLSGEVVRGDVNATLQPVRWLNLGAHAGVSHARQEVFSIGALRNFFVDGYLFNASLEGEAGPVKVRGYYNGTRLRVAPQLKSSAAADPFTQVKADVLDVEGIYSTQFRLLGEHHVVAGASYRLKTLDWGFLSGPQLEHHGGVFGEDTWVGPGGHRVVVSGRMDRHPLVGLVPSARGAFLLKTGRASALRAVFGTAFRNPTFLESYLDATLASPVAGVSIHSLGNKGLRPEQNLMGEVGYSSEIGDAITVDLSVYYGRLQGLIVQGPLLRPSSGQAYDPATSTFIAGESRFLNDDEVFSQLGSEAGFTLNPLEGLDLYANYAYLRVLEEKSGKFNRQTPTHKLNVGGRYRSPLGLVFSADGHGVSAAQWAERTFDGNAPGGVRVERLEVAPYVLVELRAAWRSPGDHLELFIQSDNVLGVLPFDTPSRLEHSALSAASPYLWPVSAHREHPFGNPNPARVMVGVSSQL